MTTAAREKDLIQAADLLLDARRTNTPIADLPKELRPVTLDEAYFVQDRMALAFGAIGGWKVGAPTPEATPSFAPMPAAWMTCNGCEMSGITHRYRGTEAEIAFKLGADLPPRETPYKLDEVVAAIESMHPAIEVLETALIDPKEATKLTSVADMSMHGGFVYGDAVPGWESIDFAQESVTLTIDGSVRVERTGSNTAGDLMRLLPWLATEGASRTEGLKKGDWITTGSWTGNTPATSGALVEARFARAGKVMLRFA
ncbi:MAG TPA: fumarylacetoacetate hydrolase family protein [Edaphobacter sp.]